MNFFDFHCDTIGECVLQHKSLSANDLHIDLQKAACFKQYGQLFAVWIPDEKRGEEAFSYLKRCGIAFIGNAPKMRVE